MVDANTGMHDESDSSNTIERLVIAIGWAFVLYGAFRYWTIGSDMPVNGRVDRSREAFLELMLHGTGIFILFTHATILRLKRNIVIPTSIYIALLFALIMACLYGFLDVLPS